MVATELQDTNLSWGKPSGCNALSSLLLQMVPVSKLRNRHTLYCSVEVPLVFWLLVSLDCFSSSLQEILINEWENMAAFSAILEEIVLGLTPCNICTRCDVINDWCYICFTSETKFETELHRVEEELLKLIKIDCKLSEGKNQMWLHMKFGI